MQRTETITIAGIDVTVSEIPVTRIYRMLQGERSIIALPLTEALEEVRALLPLALECDMDALLAQDIYTGDLDVLYEAFKRTNPVFFRIASTLNLESVLAQTVQSLLTAFSSRFAGSLPPVTASLSGITDTAISATASKPSRKSKRSQTAATP